MRSSDPIKGVCSRRQNEGGHGSWKPLRSRVTTYVPIELAPKMDDAAAHGLYPTAGSNKLRKEIMSWRVGWRGASRRSPGGVSPGEASASADLGGSCKYSSENLED